MLHLSYNFHHKEEERLHNPSLLFRRITKRLRPKQKCKTIHCKDFLICKQIYRVFIFLKKIFLCIFVQGRWQPTQSQLIQIYSVDWTDVYDTHNIEHRTEPVSH